MDYHHEPVMLAEATGLLVENLSSDKPNILVDCTFGGAGYSRKLLDITSTDTKIAAIDRDEFAIKNAKEILSDDSSRVFLCKENFADIKSIVNKLFGENTKVDGMVMDLGLSTYQIESEDGFSYQRDTELDMRADKDQNLKAKDVLNKYDEKSLLKIFKEYGELKYTKQITRDIIEQRKQKKFETTTELVELLKKKIPLRYLNRDLSKIFQSLRIEVNNELENLKQALIDCVDILIPGGRVVVVSYHSLEDRIVKNIFRQSENLKVITKKPVLPNDEEVRLNRKARSAKLRAAERK